LPLLDLTLGEVLGYPSNPIKPAFQGVGVFPAGLTQCNDEVNPERALTQSAKKSQDITKPTWKCTNSSWVPMGFLMKVIYNK